MKQSRPQTSADGRRFKEKWSTLLVGALAVTMLGAFVLLVWHKANERVPTGDYEGRIVDRWGDYSESQQGSRPRLRLAVEAHDGKRFTVTVDPNVYESAKVGMRIKSRAGQIVLIDSEKKTGGK